MTGDPPPSPFAAPPPPPRRGRLLWLVALAAFAIGLAAMYYLLPRIERWRGTEPPSTRAAQPVATSPAATAPSAVPADPATLDALTVRAAALDAQLRGIEGRMAATDTASRTAAQYARRAEGLMVAFSARRALERGLPLGYVEGQLRERFGTDHPREVAAIVGAVGSPTLADLREGLTRIAPTLTTGARHDSFATTAWRELSNLVVLRREDTPSPRPDDRLQRARLTLDGGNVEGALAEVARMPGAADAATWIEAAKRYIETRRALATLERAAIGSAAPVPEGTPAAPPVPATNPAGTLPGA